jgi:ribosomal protein S18 acetylase RimI-like enzyme
VLPNAGFLLTWQTICTYARNSITLKVTMPAAIRIRQAEDSDAPALAVLAEKAFRDAFAALNTIADMQMHCAQSYGQALQLAEIRDPSRETFVVESDGSLAAYAQLRLDAKSPRVTGDRQMEIQRFYVDAKYHGAGIAHQLMGHIVARAGAAGDSALWLGVWERNPKAIAFYRKWGFDVVGEHIFNLGNDPQRDLVMRRAEQLPGRD